MFKSVLHVFDQVNFSNASLGNENVTLIECFMTPHAVYWFVLLLLVLKVWFDVTGSKFISPLRFIKNKLDYVVYDLSLTLAISLGKNAPSPKDVTFFQTIQIIFYILVCGNVLGLVPYYSTITASLTIPFFLSLIPAFILLVMGVNARGSHYIGFWGFLGLPRLFEAFLTIVELFSFCIRYVSLGMRLFANMFSGHSLLGILSQSAYACSSSLFGFLISLVGPWVICMVIYGLEVLIAFMQVYIFTALFCIYFGGFYNH